MIHNPGLHPQTAQGVGLKQILVQLVDPGIGPDALRRHGEGMGGGVGIAEAASVGGQSHIHRLRQIPVRLHAHFHQHVPHHLGAGSTGGVHQLRIGERSSRGVVVNPQGNVSQQIGVDVGNQLGRGHVHTDNGVSLCHGVLGQPGVQPGKPGRQIGIGQDVGGFSQHPQPPAQCSSGAQGISVRPPVGQNGIVIPLQQETGSLSSVPDRHRGAPRES